ncbi:MAG: HAMP domain-containing protein, partial [Comamonadaceae bacterium]
MKLSLILRSLRGKIFFLVLTILGGVAAVVMLVSQNDVTRTVSANEQHAVSNVMNLVERDIQARWAALLSDKITTVRSGRRQLMETGTTLGAVLDSYSQLATSGVISNETAQIMARDWISGLRLGEQRFAFAYDNNGRVIASGRKDDIGRDITQVEDFKGRPLARAMYEDSRNTGHGFAIYRWPTGASVVETRYAYFGYFRAWDWVVVVSDDVRDVVAQVDLQRDQMKDAMREALSKLTLARSGFLFIATEDGSMVVAPPAAQQSLLDAMDRRSGATLRQMLNDQDPAALPPSSVMQTAEGAWHIESSRFKPLGWTLVAAVPESDFTAPADALIHRQALIFLITLLLALLATWMIAVRIVRPLDQLTRYSLYLSRHDLKIAPPVPDHITALPDAHRDEVGRLARSFMLMDQRLRMNAAELVTVRMPYKVQADEEDAQLALRFIDGAEGLVVNIQHGVDG